MGTVAPNPEKCGCSSISWAFCSDETLMYFINITSDLCPVIFMIETVGTPAKNAFVANERRAVCVVSISRFCAVSVNRLPPWVRVRSTGVVNPATCPSSLRYCRGAGAIKFLIRHGAGWVRLRI